MDEDNQQNLNTGDTSESASTATESVDTVPPTSTPVDSTTSHRKRRMYYSIGAVVLVVLILGGMLFIMERNGQINTNIFSGIERKLAAHSTVATVNGEEISEYDLLVSQEQISAGAVAQGVDVASAEVQTEIRDQALEVLINTELLLQEATKRGITVTDEEVTARYETLLQEVGGEEVLTERMKDFGITEDILLRDIRNELAIQKLLDVVFEEETIDVSEEEIVQLYESAGGESAGLPALSEVEEQIRQQIIATKEQEIINGFIATLREAAEIEITL